MTLAALLAVPGVSELLATIITTVTEKIASEAIHEFMHRRATDPLFLAQSDAWDASRRAIRTEEDKDASQKALQALMALPPSA